MSFCWKTALMGLIALAAWGQGAALEEEKNSAFAIRADKIFCGDGSVVENGCIIIRDGEVLQLGANLEMSEDTTVYSCDAGGAVTPGLIDAASEAGIIDRRSWADHSSEVIPQMRNLDALDLDCKTFQRLAARGVTTVYVTPDPSSVIGCRGAVVKTGGPITGEIRSWRRMCQDRCRPA